MRTVRAARDLLLPVAALAVVWCVLGGAAFAGVTIRSAVRAQDHLLQRASQVSRVLADAGRAEALVAAMGDPKTNPAGMDGMRAELTALADRIRVQSNAWRRDLEPQPQSGTAGGPLSLRPGPGTDAVFASAVARSGPQLVDLSEHFAATARRAALPGAALAPGQLLRGSLDGDYLVLRTQSVAVHDAVRGAAATADERWSWLVSVVLTVTATAGVALTWLLLGPIRRRLARQRRDAAHAHEAREQAMNTLGRVLDSLDVPVLVVNADDSYVDANAFAITQFPFLCTPRTAVRDLTGVLFTSPEATELGWADLPILHVLQTGSAASLLVNLPRDSAGPPSGHQAPTATVLTAAAGEARLLRYAVNVHPVTDLDGRVLGAVASFQDITELHARAERHARHAAQLATIREATSAILRQDDARSSVCEAARAVCGGAVTLLFEDDGHGDLVCTAASGADVFGMRMPIHGRSMTAATFAQARTHTADNLAGERDVDRAAVATLASACGLPLNAGAWIPVTTAGRCRAVLAVGFTDCQPVADHLPTLEVLAGEAAVALDRQDLIRRLAQDAEIDALTGAANRRAWDTCLDQAVRHAHQKVEPLTLVMLDLDHFKAYNDTHGHPAGDALLRQSVTAWRTTIRPDDFLARYGGEEFAVLLTNCTSSDALTVADKLRRAMPAGQTCSAGIATLQLREAPASLVERADQALYRAKRAGRDRALVADLKPPS